MFATWQEFWFVEEAVVLILACWILVSLKRAQWTGLGKWAALVLLVILAYVGLLGIASTSSLYRIWNNFDLVTFIYLDEILVGGFLACCIIWHCVKNDDRQSKLNKFCETAFHWPAGLLALAILAPALYLHVGLAVTEDMRQKTSRPPAAHITNQR